MFINSFQEKIWGDKYQYDDETFEEFCYRVASNIFPKSHRKRERLIKSMMKFKTLFGGRINSNIGVPEQGLTLFNCFIESTAKQPDSLEGIMDMVTKYALTLKTEGGVGFCANYLRPAKTIIKKIGVTTPGAVKFLEIFDRVSEVITSGSTSKSDSFQGVPTKKSIRKGATMVTMSVNHPDIEEFITAKSVPNRLTKMNMSVLITDAFMYAMENNIDWDLWFPDINCDKYDLEWDGDFEKWAEKGLPCVVYKTIKAVDLWDLLLKSSYCVPESLELPAYHNDKLVQLTIGKLHEMVQRGSDIKVLSVNKETLKLEKKRVLNSVCTGEKDILDITTSSNLHYKCTDKHRLFGITEGNPFYEIEAKDFFIDDYICRTNKNNIENSVTDTEYVDKDLLTFAGLVLGDGSVRKGQTRIATHIDQLDEVLELTNRIAERFDTTCKLTHDKRSDSWVEVNIYSVKLSSFLETFMYRSKFIEQRTSIKEIPSYLFTTVVIEDVKNFISGYLSADGCINGQKTTYYSMHDHIAIGIQRLLLRIGVIGRKYKIIHKEFNVTGFRVDIDCLNSEKLLREIPKFLIESKVNREAYDNIMSYKAPIKIMEYDSTKYFSNKSCLYKKNGRTDKNNFPVKYHNIFNGDICHEKIVSIDKSEKSITYDISVEDNENFICVDGGVYHNCRNEPGILFIDNARKMNNLWYLNGSMLACNPCQPKWATVLTKLGIKQFKDVNIGDEIWSEDSWVTIVDKQFTGIKEVYKYRTNANVFYGTKNHRIVSEGKKIQVGDAVTIDTIEGENKDIIKHNPQVVMDGLVLGDGSVHKASNNLVYLCIGESDKDYFESEVKSYITVHRSNAFKEHGWEIKTDLQYKEVPLTYKRRVPDRYLYGDTKTVTSFLRGLFSANGTVICNKKTKVVRFKSASKGLVEDVQIMLSSLGIRSYITTNKPTKVKHSNGVYESKISYDINITKHTILFECMIGFLQEYKQIKLKEINKRVLSNREKTSFNINEIEYMSTEEVFEITVSGNHHTYWSGGCNVSNCAEIISHTGIEIYKGKEVELGDVCNLGSMNLAKYYDIVNQKFLMSEFLEDVELMVEALDNIVEVSNYPLDIYKDAAILKRKIGLGFTGVGSLLMMSGMRYGSDESVVMMEEILKEFVNRVYQTSSLLAKKKGVFPLYDKKLIEGGYVANSGVLTDETLSMIEKYGLRNGALMAIAPCGTLSILAGNVSGGLEPVFDKEFYRWNRVEGRKTNFKYPNIHKGEWFETDYFKEVQIADEIVLISKDEEYRIDKNSGLCEKIVIRDYGYDQAVEHGIDTSGLGTAMELTVEEHLNILSIFSKYIDQSSSKCVALNTRINTNNGVIKIGSISDNRKKDSFKDVNNDLIVITEKGIKPINSFYYNGSVDGKHIETVSGFELSGSDIHRIKVLDKNHELVWKSLSKINVGDIVPIQLKNDLSLEKTISKIVGKSFTKPKNCKSITIPTQLNKNLMWWLGCIQADGHVNNIGVHLTQVSGKTLNRFIEVSKLLFDWTPTLVRDLRRDSLFRISINSKVLSLWMDYIGFKKSCITELVFSSPRLEKKSFLEGTTLDGYISNNSICCKTDKNLKVIKDLQLLYSNIGIATYIQSNYNKEYKQDYYDLIVVHSSIIKMSSFVFPEEHKQKLFLKLYNSKPYRNSASISHLNVRIPINDDFFEGIKQIESKVSLSTPLYNIFHRIANDAKKYKSLTLDQILTVYTFLGIIPEIFSKKNYFFTKIVKVENIYVETGDIEVPEDHSYIANGFVSHNTINLKNGITLEDFKKVYNQIYKYGIKGCTTYREGTSVAVLESTKKEKNKSVKIQQKEFLDSFKGQENGDFVIDDVKLPEEYPAKGYILKSEKRKWYVHVAFKNKACTKPFAIFVNTNNREDNVTTYDALEKMEEIALAKGLKEHHIEEIKRKYAYQKNPVKICRMLGLLLRHNVPIYTIVQGFNELEGATIGTFVFRIKKFLAGYIKEYDVTGMVCPECGEKAIRFTEGCYNCTSCGYSRCG